MEEINKINGKTHVVGEYVFVGRDEIKIFVFNEEDESDMGIDILLSLDLTNRLWAVRIHSAENISRSAFDFISSFLADKWEEAEENEISYLNSY